MSYDHELSIAKEAVRQASVLCAAAQAGLTSSEQMDKADKSPVTVAHYGAQALVLKILGDSFPDDTAVGDEDAGYLTIKVFGYAI